MASNKRFNEVYEDISTFLNSRINELSSIEFNEQISAKKKADIAMYFNKEYSELTSIEKKLGQIYSNIESHNDNSNEDNINLALTDVRKVKLENLLNSNNVDVSQFPLFNLNGNHYSIPFDGVDIDILQHFINLKTSDSDKYGYRVIIYIPTSNNYDMYRAIILDCNGNEITVHSNQFQKLYDEYTDHLNDIEWLTNNSVGFIEKIIQNGNAIMNAFSSLLQGVLIDENLYLSYKTKLLNLYNVLYFQLIYETTLVDDDKVQEYYKINNKFYFDKMQEVKFPALSLIENLNTLNILTINLNRKHWEKSVGNKQLIGLSNQKLNNVFENFSDMNYMRLQNDLYQTDTVKNVTMILTK